MTITKPLRVSQRTFDTTCAVQKLTSLNKTETLDLLVRCGVTFLRPEGIDLHDPVALRGEFMTYQLAEADFAALRGSFTTGRKTPVSTKRKSGRGRVGKRSTARKGKLRVKRVGLH